MTLRSAKAIRSKLKHPVIDADGHWIDFPPALEEFFARVDPKAAAGLKAMQGARSGIGKQAFQPLSVEQRRARRVIQPRWWGTSTRTRDRAICMLPRLYYEQMDELGFDFAVLYPTNTMVYTRFPDDIRRATCRAFNMYVADHFAKYADRMTPAAFIPMNRPEDAIAELEFASKELGLKVALLENLIVRPVKEETDDSRRVWVDKLALDTAFDYDPVWAKCRELGMAPSFHKGSNGLDLHDSPVNFVYNHLGHLAAGNDATCRALFLDGVTRRFPGLKFAFLEGGVGWACSLYANLINDWKRRNPEALKNVDPSHLDRRELAELFRRFGPQAMAEKVADPEVMLDPLMSHPPGQMDDFEASGISRPEQIRERFVEPFFFGCEADDRINAWAFNRKLNPYQARLQIMLGSDIGHFDVPDIFDVLPEAYELVDEELIGEDDFRDFVCGNAIRFFGGNNPDFFKGTAVERQAASMLERVR